MENSLNKWFAVEIGGWLVAVIATFGAVSAVNSIRETGAIAAPALSIPSVTRVSQALKSNDYQRLKDLVQPFSGETVIEVASEHIKVTHPKIGSHAEWQLAVANIMHAAPLAQWEVVEMCAGIKCPDVPYSVTLAASVGQFNVQ